MDTQQLQQRYGRSESGNFWIKDTIGVPHPFCITPRHVQIADDHHGGMLGESALQEADRLGVQCGMRGCRLSFSEHERALLISCKLELKGEDGKINLELFDYIKACGPLCEQDGYAGFAFLKEQ